MRNVEKVEVGGGGCAFRFGRVPLQDEKLVRRMLNYVRKNRSFGWELENNPHYLAAQIARIGKPEQRYEDRAAAIILAVESTLIREHGGPFGDLVYSTTAGQGVIRELSLLLANPSLDVRLRVIAEEARLIVAGRNGAV